MEDSTQKEAVKKAYAHSWKKMRVHHLIRLGGDIIQSGLSDYPKATLLGGLLHCAKMSEEEIADK